jgi:putative membrane protein
MAGWNPLKTNDFAHAGRGLLMGGADIIPGVSGGTVALILGIYVRLVTAISRFDITFLSYLKQRRWTQAAQHVDLRFLVALATGILVGIVSLATLMNYLLEHQLTLTLAAFFGLILASSFLVARSVRQWTLLGLLLAIAGICFAYWLVGQPFWGGKHTNFYLFFCGMVAICAMILPGISGAFILLIMGEYEYVTGIIRGIVHGNVQVALVITLVVFASGCAVGLLGFSKLLRWLLTRYHAQTLAVLCGFMIGSLRRIWPFKQPIGEAADLRHSQLENVLPDTLDQQVILAVALGLLAMAFVVFLDWLTRRLGARQSVAVSADQPSQA